MLAGSVLCLLGGALLGYVELQAIGAAGVLMSALALAWALPTPPLVVDRAIEPSRVARGEPAFGLLRAEHTGRLPVGASTAADWVAGSWVEVGIPRMRPGARRELTYRLPTARRGRYAVGPLTVTTADPLRLLRRDIRAGALAELWVHPRLIPVLTAPIGRSRDLDGPTSPNAPEGSITFQSLREYVVGDDLRRVHWRTSARTGTLMVRQHVDSSRPDVAVLLDDRADVYAAEEDFEQAVDLAASLAAALRGADFPCRVRCVSGAAVRGGELMDDRRVLLDGLAEVAAHADANGALLDTAVARLSGGTAAILVTGGPAESDLERLLVLRRNYGKVLALCVTSAPVPPVRGVQVLAAADADRLATRWASEAGR